MHITLRSCTADNREGEKNDEHEEDDLNQRGKVFEPSENRVWHDEDDAGHDQEYSDCLLGQLSETSTLIRATKNGSIALQPHIQHHRQGISHSREAALGKSPPAQNWMRILKKAASEATIEVHPAPQSAAAH